MPRGRRGPGSRIRPVLAATALVALLAPVPAGAQSDANVGKLVEKVERLQRELSTLQRAVYAGEDPPEPAEAEEAAAAGEERESSAGGMSSAAAAQLQSRISGLTQELQRLTGRIEETGFKLRKLSDRVDRLAKDVDFRLSRLEERVGGGGDSAVGGEVQQPAVAAAGSGGDAAGSRAAADGGEGRSTGDGESRTLGSVSQRTVDDLKAEQAASAEQNASDVLPDASAGEQYQHAFGLLQQADYERAESALQAFVKANPEHDLAGNAKYWLAETHYVRGNYKKAAATFAEGYKQYPEGGKAPDNLLKLGMSLAALERTEDACGIYRELMKQYPDAPANIRQRAKREQQKLDCPQA